MDSGETAGATSELAVCAPTQPRPKDGEQVAQREQGGIAAGALTPGEYVGKGQGLGVGS